MRTRNKRTLIFLATYLFCLLLDPVILNWLLGRDVELWRDFWCYLALGVVGCFCKEKARHFILLFLLPDVILDFLQKTLSWRFWEDTYNTVVTMILFSAFFILWQTSVRPRVNVWQNFAVVCLNFLFLLLSPYLLYGSSWYNFATSNSYFIATYSTYAIGLFLTSAFYSMRLRWLKAGLLGVLCLYFFASGFFVAPAIRDKLVFGTFTGRTEEKVSLTLKTPDGKETDIKDAFHGYHVCMVSHALNQLPTKKFEGLAGMFSGRPVEFSILAAESFMGLEEKFLPRYRTLHVRLPLYTIDWKALHASPLHAEHGYEYICIFKNDTLIYKGKADPTDRAARFLAKELQP